MILILGAIATAIGTGGTVYFGKKISQREKNALGKLEVEFSSEKAQSQEKTSTLEDTISKQSQKILSQEKKLKELQKDVYKPLAEDRQENLISGLNELREEYSTISPSVSILYQQGSMVRGNVGADLKKYLQKAGWQVDLRGGMIFSSSDTPSALSVRYHPEDKQFLIKFTNIINPLFINERINASENNKVVRGQLEIKIKGDPLFDDSGVVTFK
jgi:hypothetical protein